MDIKIKVDRPEAEEAKDIFSIYLTPDLPIAPSVLERFDGDREKAVQSLAGQAIEKMYATTDENKFIEVTYNRGEREILYFKDFASGAMIENIVDRAKKMAIKRLIDSEGKRRELPLMTSKRQSKKSIRRTRICPTPPIPDDWAKISGRKGDRIVNIKALTHEPEPKRRDVRTVKGGAYL